MLLKAIDIEDAALLPPLMLLISRRLIFDATCCRTVTVSITIFAPRRRHTPLFARCCRQAIFIRAAMPLRHISSLRLHH